MAGACTHSGSDSCSNHPARSSHRLRLEPGLSAAAATHVAVYDGARVEEPVCRSARHKAGDDLVQSTRLAPYMPRHGGWPLRRRGRL